MVEKHNTLIRIKDKLVDCQVEGCPDKAKTPGRLQEHFIFRYCKLKVAIFQEGPEPLQRWGQWGMHIQYARLFKHRQSDKFHKLMERSLRRRDVDMTERCG